MFFFLVSYIEEQAILIEQRNLLKRHFVRWFCRLVIYFRFRTLFNKNKVIILLSFLRIQHIDNHVQLAKRYRNQCCGRLLNKFFTKWLSKYKTKTKNNEILIENFKLWRLKLIYNLLNGANQEALLSKYFNMWRISFYYFNVTSLLKNL